MYQTFIELKAQEDQIRSALKDNLEAQDEVFSDFYKKTGICEGAEIEFKDFGIVRKAFVSSIHLLPKGDYYLRIYTLKKDGSIQRSMRRVEKKEVISVKPKQNP